MFSPNVVLREAYYDQNLKKQLETYAADHSITVEEATQSSIIQNYVRRHSEI